MYSQSTYLAVYIVAMSSADQLKTLKVQLRLTPLEREYLEALAAKQQMSISEYLRSLIHREAAKLK